MVTDAAPADTNGVLLGAAVNHDVGATSLIAKMVEGWHGKLHRTQRWEDLQNTALYWNDLRVRAAAIEINLVVLNLAKTGEAADQLIDSARKDPGYRPFAAWELGMLANRGVEAVRIHQLLAEWIHASNQQVRFWSVEGLAHFGTDDTIKNFLDVFRNDPSLDATTRSWVYQALREITNVNLPNEPAAWRNWYSTHGADKKREFGTGDSWSVLGNS